MSNGRFTIQNVLINPSVQEICSQRQILETVALIVSLNPEKINCLGYHPWLSRRLSLSGPRLLQLLIGGPSKIYLNHNEIKLLGEDRIINYFWKWYEKSENKDQPWKNINKDSDQNVYEKVILKYPPEIKKLEIRNNIDIIRKTLIRFAAPLLIFMLII